MEYMIICEESTEELAKEVNKEIKKGWKPFGGVSIALGESDFNRSFKVAQALTKGYTRSVHEAYCKGSNKWDRS
jgi:hypothetical protein